MTGHISVEECGNVASGKECPNYEPGDEGEAIGVVECLRNVLAEGVAGASGRDAPATPGKASFTLDSGLIIFDLSSGSDQSRSHMGPSCGTSCSRSRALEREHLSGRRNCYR